MREREPRTCVWWWWGGYRKQVRKKGRKKASVAVVTEICRVC